MIKRRAFAFLVEDMSTEDALDCGRYQHRDCLWGAIAALNGLAVLPADMRSPQSVPRAWDLLSALRALAPHGYGGDPRFAPLLDLFLARQDEQGRWLCGSVSRTLRQAQGRLWPLGKRNRP